MPFYKNPRSFRRTIRIIIFLFILPFSPYLLSDPSSAVPLQGLDLWLRADAGVQQASQAVSSWRDQSGNGHQAAQPTSGNRPRFVPNAVNGKPVVRFNGSNQFMNFNLPVNGLTGMTIVLVSSSAVDKDGSWNGADSSPITWKETADWGTVHLNPQQRYVKFRFGTGQVNNLPIYTRASPVKSGYSLSTVIKNGSTESLFINGKSALTQGGKLAKINRVSASANLGRGYTGYFAGDIAEVLVYTRALSTAERQAVESYLLTKYINVNSALANRAPTVSAGSDQTIALPAPATLLAKVDDDGLPSSQLAVNWSVISGPGQVVFSDATSATSRATFSAPGSYALKVTASDGTLSTSDDLTVEVVAAHASVPEEAPVFEPEDTMPAPPSNGGAKTYATEDYIYPSDSGYFNVKDEPYACYGDGRHDDTACIKAAMDAAMHVGPTAGRHATVYFPEGTYLISDTLLWATYGDDNAVVTAKVDASRGCITGFTIANAGSGYSSASWGVHGESNPGPALYLMGGGGSAAEFYTTRAGDGWVTGIQAGLGNMGSANCAGHGYTSAPKVKVLNWRAYLRFEGQNKANTTIRLTDNNPKFQNANCNVSPHGDNQAAESCNAMIKTASERDGNSIGSGENAYENDIWNLTIDTGSGNPGAIALDWAGSNRASVKNVNIISGEGRGRCGLNVSRGSTGGTGPAYVKNVSIRGFDYGIYANSSAHEVGNTFEYIDLANIHTAGVVNGNMPNWFRQVSANIAAPVFIDQGAGSLLVTDGNFTGGSSNTTAIRAPATSAHGIVFLRNIETSGYAAALAIGSANTIVPGADISEYAYPAPASQFPSSMTSLNFPNIPNTPEYIDNNLSDWASVGTYGAACNPNSGKDATSCIQAAMNSGKPVVYFPFGGYWASSTIHIPSSVRVVLGMNSVLQSAMRTGAYPNVDGKHRAAYCTIQFDGSGSHPVEFRNFGFQQSTQSNTFCYNGSAPMVLADISGGVNISNTSKGSGTIYLENVAVPNANYDLGPKQHVYARQYDIESGTGVHVTTNGGIWWMLGFKSEGAGLLWDVSNATFELLGSFSTTAHGPSASPAFVFKDSDFSLAGVATKANGWHTAVSEKRGGTTLNAPINGLWSGGIGYGLYSGHN